MPHVSSNDPPPVYRRADVWLLRGPTADGVRGSRGCIMKCDLDALLRALKAKGCHPSIYRRGRLWRAHVNAAGNFWEDRQTPTEALLAASEAWHLAGSPKEGPPNPAQGKKALHEVMWQEYCKLLKEHCGPRAELPDPQKLVRRALTNLGTIISRRYAGIRWNAVARLMGLGSTYATILCSAYDLDPDEEIGPTEWEALEALFGEDGIDVEDWERCFECDPPPESERYR